MSGYLHKLSCYKSQKMLASTVQFSTYDQSLPNRPRRTRDLPQETRRYENRRALTEITVARSLRTQQRAYEPDCPPPPRSTPRRAVLAAADDAGRTGQRSTLEHHPRRVRPVESDGPS